MNMRLTQDFFVGNRRALRQACKEQLPIIVLGNGLVQRTADTTLPFTQDSNFWYLSGIALPDCAIVIDENESYLIVPGRSETRQTFDGSVDQAALIDRSGIDAIYSETEGWARFQAAASRQNRFSAPLSSATSYISTYGMHVNPGRRRLLAKARRLASDATAHDIRKQLARLRSIKQPEELSCMAAAAQLTKSTLEKLVDDGTFRTLHYEYELEAAISYQFRLAGAAGHAYAPIIAAGSNATTLHYVANEAVIKPTDFVVVDVGAEIEHYAADITRTLHQGTPSARQRALYDAVSSTQRELLELLRPGAVLPEVEAAAELIIGQKLKSLGLITDAANHDAIRMFYPHGSSHFLGLDVHDVGDYHAPLEPGMVLTCEPGIYCPAEGIGVRIEDDVLITAAGNRVL